MICQPSVRQVLCHPGCQEWCAAYLQSYFSYLPVRLERQVRHFDRQHHCVRQVYVERLGLARCQLERVQAVQQVLKQLVQLDPLHLHSRSHAAKRQQVKQGANPESNDWSCKETSNCYAAAVPVSPLFQSDLVPTLVLGGFP